MVNKEAVFSKTQGDDNIKKKSPPSQNMGL
jgi:hypothetical protein